MRTSFGHEACVADVIIASIRWPESRLKSRLEHTRAGRRFAAFRSVNGNGTTTTSPGSESGERVVVIGGVPFGCERGFERAEVRLIRKCLSHAHVSVIVDEELDAIAGAELQGIADWLRDGGLVLGGQCRSRQGSLRGT
jgi:hypothetical protein